MGLLLQRAQILVGLTSQRSPQKYFTNNSSLQVNPRGLALFAPFVDSSAQGGYNSADTGTSSLYPQCFSMKISGMSGDYAHLTPWASGTWTYLVDYGIGNWQGWVSSTYNPPGLVNRAAVANWTYTNGSNTYTLFQGFSQYTYFMIYPTQPAGATTGLGVAYGLTIPAGTPYVLQVAAGMEVNGAFTTHYFDHIGSMPFPGMTDAAGVAMTYTNSYAGVWYADPLMSGASCTLTQSI